MVEWSYSGLCMEHPCCNKRGIHITSVYQKAQYHFLGGCDLFLQIDNYTFELAANNNIL